MGSVDAGKFANNYCLSLLGTMAREICTFSDFLPRVFLVKYQLNEVQIRFIFSFAYSLILNKYFTGWQKK